MTIVDAHPSVFPFFRTGEMISIVAPESCIGCFDCELSCPDFAIFVAEKGEYKFSKLSDEAKIRSEAIKANNYRALGA